MTATFIPLNTLSLNLNDGFNNSLATKPRIDFRCMCIIYKHRNIYIYKLLNPLYDTQLYIIGTFKRTIGARILGVYRSRSFV